MASIGVVGQHPGPHRLDSESQLLLFKLAHGRKKISLPRKSHRERIMFGRTSRSYADNTTVPAGECVSDVSSPGPAGEAAATAASGGRMPCEGCAAAVSPAAPRSSPGGPGCDWRAAAWSSESQMNSDHNSNHDWDSNRNAGAPPKSDPKVTPRTAVANGHRRAHPQRDRPPGRCDSGLEGTSDRSVNGDTGGLPLARLTQGRTGVVKLARAEPPRREAWSIFPQGRDPRVRTERGEGHRFESRPVTQDWCDACSRQITAQTLKCQNCSYTCHLECENQVQLDCNQRDKKPEEVPSAKSHSSTPPVPKTEVKEEEDGATKDLSDDEARAKIEEYNAQVSENGMKLASDGSYTGFIKVHLRLSRPVTVPALEAGSPEGAPRQSDRSSQAMTPAEGQEGVDCGPNEKKTSFYLPCDCVKQLHISSLTTTREVIQGLLKKFMVLDNPQKFALYRQMHRDGQDLFQKLPLYERPLLLRLIAGPDPEQLSFVLKENDTGEVEWHAFSVPELQNFLVILEKEEAERIRIVEHKYTVYRQKLQQALQQHDP